MSEDQEQPATLAVRFLPAAAGDDAVLVDRLAALINAVYATAERGLWREGSSRTSTSALAELVRAGEIAVATRHGSLVGCVRVHDGAEDTGELGMLASAPAERGTGVGRALAAFAEEHSRRRGLRAIQLELLVPRTWRNPSKELLRAWYGRLGYRVIRTVEIDDVYPQLLPLLPTPCVIEVYEKPLRPDGGAPSPG